MSRLGSIGGVTAAAVATSLLLCLTVLPLAAADLSSEYSNTLELSSTYAANLYWTLQPSAQSIDFAFSILNNNGVVGFGFAAAQDGGMAPSKIVIGRSSNDIREFSVTQQELSGITQFSSQYISNQQTSVENGKFIMKWRYPYSNANHPFDPLVYHPLLWAQGPSSGILGYHGDRRGYRYWVNFSEPTVSCTGCTGAHQVCVAPSTCQCAQGWTGANCDIQSTVYAPFDGKYTFRTELSSSRSMHVWWSLNTTHASFALRAKTTGYISFGWTLSGGMTNSFVVIGTVVGSTSTVREYAITSKSVSGVSPLAGNANQIINLGGFEDNQGFTYFEFVRPLSTPEYTIQPAADTDCIWAIGNSDSIVEHVSKGELAINFQTGSQKSSSSKSKQVGAHGVLMVVGMLICMPLAVFAARFGRNVKSKCRESEDFWFTTHKSLNSLGVVLMIIAFALIVNYVEKEKASHFSSSTHAKLGLAIFIIALTQALNGILRAKKGAPYRRAWEVLHRLSGFVVILLSTINVFTGMDLYGAKDALVVVVAIWVSLYAASFVFFELRERLSRKKQSNSDSLSSSSRPLNTMDLN